METLAAAEVKVYRFSVEEYHKMGEVGIFGPGRRVELIRGEIVEMSPIGDPHAACVIRFTRGFYRLIFSGAVDALEGVAVSVQNPIRLPNSEPDPDLVLVKARGIVTGAPRPEDILVVVEVSDTTLRYDRNVKLPLYAEFGIPEVWISDLKGRKVEVHSDPAPDGYRSIRIFGPAERVVSATVEGLSLPVDEVIA